jgi:hypothetical protein
MECIIDIVIFGGFIQHFVNSPKESHNIVWPSDVAAQNSALCNECHLNNLRRQASKKGS